MKALLFAALCALLLAPTVTADDAGSHCLVDGSRPDIDLICTGPFEVCVADGDVWDRLTREGTCRFAT